MPNELCEGGFGTRPNPNKPGAGNRQPGFSQPKPEKGTVGAPVEPARTKTTAGEERRPKPTKPGSR